MIRRLIEQQQIGAGDDCPRRSTRRFIPEESDSKAASGEAHLGQNPLDALLRLPGGLMVVPGRGDGLCYHIVNRAGQMLGHFLREERRGGAGSKGKLTAIGHFLSAQEFKQRCLARAVSA